MRSLLLPQDMSLCSSLRHLFLLQSLRSRLLITNIKCDEDFVETVMDGLLASLLPIFDKPIHPLSKRYAVMTLDIVLELLEGKQIRTSIADHYQNVIWRIIHAWNDADVLSSTLLLIQGRMYRYCSIKSKELHITKLISLKRRFKASKSTLQYILKNLRECMSQSPQVFRHQLIEEVATSVFFEAARNDSDRGQLAQEISRTCDFLVNEFPQIENGRFA